MTGVVDQTDLEAIETGIDSVLDNIENVLELTVYAEDLPIIGTHLSAATEALETVTRLKTAIHDAIDAIQSLPNLAEMAASDVQSELQTRIDNAIAGLGNGFAGAVTATVDASTGDIGLAFDTGRDTSVTFAAGDLGMAGLGLTLDGNAQADLAYNLDFTVGLDSSGFYLDTARSGVSLGADVSLGSLSATGSFGMIHYGITNIDDADPAADADTLSLDFTSSWNDGGDNIVRSFGSSLLNLEIGGNLDLDLHLAADMGNAALPKISSDLHLDWGFDQDLLNGSGANAWGAPTLTLDNVQYDFGTFVQDFITPILVQLDPILGPINDALSVLKTDIAPILPDDWAAMLDVTGNADGSADGKVTLLDLVYGAMDLAGDPPDMAPIIQFIDTVDAITDFVEFFSGRSFADEGYDLGAYSTVVQNVQDAANALQNLDLSTGEFTSAVGDLGSFLAGLAGGGAAGFGDTHNGASGSDLIEQLVDNPLLDFPLLENPLSGIALLLGQDTDLFTFDVPTISFGPGYNSDGTLGTPITLASLPVFGPVPFVTANLTVAAQAAINFAFGYDTTGLREFAAAGFDPAQAGLVFDGFYLDDQRSGGSDMPEIIFRAAVGIAIDANFLGMSIGGGGNLAGTLLLDFADSLFGADGRLYADELPDLVANPFGVFDVSGSITAGLNAYVNAPWGNLWRWNSDRLTLADFSFVQDAGDTAGGSGGSAPPPPDLATQSGSELTLNVGLRADLRAIANTSDGDERLDIRAGAGGTVIVSGFSTGQAFGDDVAVTHITGDGNAGDDSLVAAAAFGVAVDFSGGAGSDMLAGGAADDTLSGGSEDDWLIGRAGNDTLQGGDGNDYIEGGAGADAIDGGAGTYDTATYANSTAAVTLDLSGGADAGDAVGDTFAGIEVYEGSAYADTLIGSDAGETLSGLDGDDTIDGGGGDDVLVGGDGANSLDGGDGYDIVGYYMAGGGIAVTILDDSTGWVTGGGITETLADIEQVEGSRFADTMTGGTGRQVFIGGAGNDTLDGGADGDLLAGGLGNDTYYVDAGGDSVSEAADEGTDAVFSTVNRLLGDNVENLTLLGSASTGIGNALANTITGNDGANLLQGLAGSDTISGLGGNDTIEGGTDVDTLSGGDGDDVLDGGEGGDTIDGGSGNDTVRYAGSVVGVVVNLSTASQDDGAGGKINPYSANDGTGTDTIVSAYDSSWGDYRSTIENAVGSAHDDRLIGTEDGSVLQGLAGDDALIGLGREDVLEGGAGNDFIDGGEPLVDGDWDEDVASWANDEAGVQVDLAVGTALDGSGGTDTLVGIEDLRGSAYDDELVGDNNSNWIYGGDGDDVLDPGLGRDTVFDEVHGDAGIDTLVVDWSDITTGVTRMTFTGPWEDGYAGSFDTGDGGRDLVFHGIENFHVSLGSGDDRFQTGDGNDVIALGAGDDFVTTEKGADSIDGGEGVDTWRADKSGADPLTIDLTAPSFSYVENGVTATVTGIEILGLEESVGFETLGRFTTGVGDDTIITHTGTYDDYLDTGAGNDTVKIWAGNDDVLLGVGSDRLVIDWSGTTAGISSALAAGTDDGYSGWFGGDENVDFDDVEHFTATLGSGDDTLRTGDGDDVIAGGAGDDVLATGLGFDTIDGGEGADRWQADKSDADPLTIDLNAASFDYVIGGASATVSSIEALGEDVANRFVATAGADTIVTNADFYNDYIDTGAGDDTITIRAGKDDVNAGAGEDRLVIDWSSMTEGIYFGDLVFGSLAEGYSSSYTVFGDVAGDLAGVNRVDFEGVENFTVSLGSGDDMLDTGDGDDVLDGGAGDDILDTGKGLDTIAGGAGIDRWQADKSDADALTLDLTAPQSTYAVGAGSATVSGIEALGYSFGLRFIATGGNDTITTIDAFLEDSIDTGAGDDVVTLAGGRDEVLLGAGSDRLVIDWSGMTAGVLTALTGTLVDGYSGAFGTFDGTDTDNEANFTGAEAFTLTLGSGGDSIVTGDGDDVLDGGAGDDVLSSGKGADTIDGGAGTDRWVADQSDADALTIDLTAAQSTYSVGGRSATVAGIEALGDADSYTFFIASAGGDAITTSDAFLADLVDTGAGDDTVTLAGGKDEASLGAGSDRLVIDWSGMTTDVFSGIAGTLADGYSGAFVTLADADTDNRAYFDGVESFDVTLGAGDDAITTGGGADVIAAGGGDDTIDGGGGDDAIDGGTGDDRLILDARQTGGGLSVDTGTGSVGWSGNSVDFSNIENFTIYSSAGSYADDILTGAGDDVFYHYGVNNRFYLLDRVDLGAGGDDLLVADFSAITSYAVSNDQASSSRPGYSIFTVDGAGKLDYTNVERIDFIGGTQGDSVTGLGASDTLDGRAGNDTLHGAGGDDTLIGGAGDDTLDGGAGADTASYASAAAGVTVDLSIVAAQDTGGAGTDTLTGIENLTGSAFADTLTGTGAIDAGAGDDLVRVGGAATVTLGEGADTLGFTGAFDDVAGNIVTVTDFAAGAGGDAIDWGTTLAGLLSGWDGVSNPFDGGWLRLVQSGADALVEIDADGGGDAFTTLLTFQGVEAAALTAANLGGYAAPEVYGTGGGDTLAGTAGDDDFDSGDGADVIDLSAGGDDTGAGGAGDDGFYLGGALTAGDNLDGGAGTHDQLGLQGDYSGGLTLGAGNLTGTEALVLLSGSDTRFGDNAGNAYSYDLKTIDANVGAGQQLVVNFNTLQAGENVSFDGSAETDGSFLTYGGLGTDTIVGGQKDDGFFFGADGRFSTGDSVDGQGGALDQLGFQGDYSGGITFADNAMTGIEMIVLLTADDNRFGSGSADGYSYTLTMADGNVALGQTMVIQANSLLDDATHTEVLTFNGSAETDGAYTVYGGAAGDIITGGAGTDAIWGRGGADDLTGGAGDDRFVYQGTGDSSTAAFDTIDDFTGGDTIDLSAIDADTATGGDQGFSFVGAAAFSGTAGELRADNGGAGTDWIVQADIDGNGTADFEIHVTTIGHDLVVGDFIL